MSKTRYLRIVAAIEFIGVVIGVIIFICFWGTGELSAIPTALKVFYLIILIVLGPAAGVLILTVADMHDMTLMMYEKIENDKIQKSDSIFSNYKVGDIVITTEYVLGLDGKTRIEAGTIGKVTKKYTDSVEVIFTLADGKSVSTNVQFKSINKARL